jgi:hypothetical protein
LVTTTLTHERTCQPFGLHGNDIIHEPGKS